jgi:DNA-binding NarL/FixJ family response regulator
MLCKEPGLHSSAASISILVVDDYEDWRNCVRSLLRARPELQIVCEVSDGLEAVQKAAELKPDLVLLDIGLPRLNGIEAAQRMRAVSPESQIVFLTTDNSKDTEQAALSTGAQGYVHKSRAQSDLLPLMLCGQNTASLSVRGRPN